MVKLDPEVRKELRYVVLSVIALSMVMELVYLLIGKWSAAVLGGNIAGAGASVLSFYLLCVTVQKALETKSEDAAKRVRASKSLRMLMIAAICAAAIAVLKTDAIATVVPLVFYRAGLAVYTVKSKQSKLSDNSDEGGSDLLEP